METRVINIRTAPTGWQQDANYQYIGRPGRGLSSKFGNPVRYGHVCPTCETLHPYEDGGKWMTCYETYLTKRLATDKRFRAAVMALRGKILVCYCIPKPCHGQILAAYVEQLSSEQPEQLTLEIG